MQIALDTTYWNPIMALFVFGSIIAWFVVIPFMSAGAVYTGFLPAFDFYVGVAFEVLRSATFWFYWPLATMIALTPTIITRIIRLDLFPHLVDDVRLLQKSEGRSIFKRRKIHRRTPSVRRTSVKRTGYAFAQEEGFGRMIFSGRMFGLNQVEVEQEQHKRLSQLIVSGRSTPKRPSSPPTSPSSPTIAEGIGASLAVAGSVAIGTEVEVEVHEQPSSPEVDEQIEEMARAGIKDEEAPANLSGSETSSDGEDENKVNGWSLCVCVHNVQYVEL